MLLEQVRYAVLHDWDPIRVGHVPEAEDEYDAYIPDLVQLIIQGQTEDQIFTYLWELETQHMGLAGNESATRDFAKALHRMQSVS